MRYIWYIWFGVLTGNSTAAPTLLSELSWTTVCLLDFTVQKKHAKTLLIWWSRTSLIKRKFEIIKSWWENPLLVLLSESDLQSFSYALTYLLELHILPRFLQNMVYCFSNVLGETLINVLTSSTLYWYIYTYIDLESWSITQRSQSHADD